MILQQPNAQFGFSANIARKDSRVRIGVVILANVVAVLALLNLLAGAA
jgi:hypothetical protein